ncbi:MAG: bifunctional serine/threonine-protein kinase/formylglycine-generating enzyme family protein, partial [Planctomycetota bacterium]
MSSNDVPTAGGEPNTESPSRFIGPYELLDELARGGQGVVYEVRQPGVDRRLAIKVLFDSDSTSRERFRREARVLASLQHTNLPRVVDLGEHEGQPYLVMEFLEGDSLRDLVRERGPLGVSRSVEILGVVARVVHYCHQQGVIHRDLKPANVVLEKGAGRPVLVDFGLLKLDPLRGNVSHDERASALTKSGDVLGTPSYMAPEQIDPSFGKIGPLTDVYALGATLFSLLTGEPPFAGATAYNVILKVLEQPPPNPAVLSPNVPPSLAELCAQAMAKDPGARPPAALAFANELEKAAGPPARATPRWLLTSLAALLALAVAAFGVTATRFSPGPSARETAAKTDVGQSAAKEHEPSGPGAPRPPKGFRYLRDEPFTCGDQVHTVSVFRNERFAQALGLGPSDTHLACEFVLVPGKEYTMGSPRAEGARGQDETQRKIRVKPFLLARTEVTQRVWEFVMGDNPARAPSREPSKPVESITWEDAQRFCSETGLRLPSEAEWEFACRGGTETPFAFGSTLDSRQAQFGAGNEGTTARVGSFPPNAYGLHDMHGNVQEWCQDTGARPHDRVNRGGAWNRDA